MLKTAKKKRSGEQRSNSTKVTALTMMKSNIPQAEVSRRTDTPIRTLQYWKAGAIAAGTWDLVDASGDKKARPAPRVKNPGSGAHNRKVNDRMKKKIKEAIDRDPFLTPHGLRREIPGLMKVSKETIRRVIAKELGIPSRMTATKPHLTEAQRERRLDWAQRKRTWTQRKWRKILWTDETHIELWRHARGGLRVRRSSSVSRYDPRFIRRSVKHPPKLMIWAAIGNGKVGSIYFVAPNEKMNAAMYKDVLRRHLTRSFKMTGCSVLMQDGAPCHTARSIKEWLSENDVPVLDWVGQSADGNPIENCWTRLNKILAEMPTCSNLGQLAKQISKAWKKLGKDRKYLTALTDSMPRRIQAIIDANGDVTKY